MTPQPRFDHLLRMTTPLGVFEHARGDQPRRAHGYCLDDVGRALGVAAREPEPTGDLIRLVGVAMDYVTGAVDGEGAMRNRRADCGIWSDQPRLGDHWGRALWGLGQVVASPWCDADTRQRALALARRGLRQRAPWPRAMAYAAVGAADLLGAAPGEPTAVALLSEARVALAGRCDVRGLEHWPEPRLTYANALLPEALLAIGRSLGDDRAIGRGLGQLEWLVELQLHDGRLSPTPHTGWAPGDRLPAFSQQPIEVVALAEAATRAHEVTGAAWWADVVERCAAWFLGANDLGVALYDTATGGGCDGLRPEGVNPNQGAESTLAGLATLQLAPRMARVAA